MPSSHTDKCCICTGPYDQTNFPRLMPSCDHSVCTNCLKSVFKNGIKMIICKVCGNEQVIADLDLEYFPKNINLIKQIKDNTIKKPSSITQLTTPIQITQNANTLNSNTSISSNQKQGSMSSSEFVDNNSSLLSQKSSFSSHQNEQKFICLTHNKEMELICLRDFTRLCPLCAVFGVHKQHQLKTIQETSVILAQTLNNFEETKTKKKALQSYIKNSEFKAQITQKIATAKNTLIRQIKDKFAAIKQAVEIAQKNANDDLNKRFKQVSDKINKMVKDQSEFEPLFTNWARTIELQLIQTNRIGITFEQKTRILLNGLIKSMEEGQFYLAHLQSYSYEKKKRLESIPSLVSVFVSDNLIKDIYNYLSVKFDDCLPIAYDDILVASRVDGNLPMNEKKNNIVQENNYMSQTYSASGKSGSASHISSANSIGHNQHNIMTKKPIKVQFSSSQNFLSPNAKDRLQSPSYIQPRKSPRQKSKSLPKQQIHSANTLIKSRISPQKPELNPNNKPSQMTQQRKRYLESNTEGIVELFMTDQKLDTLDLCAFDMPDNEILMLLDYVHNKKKIKCLKLSQNRLTNQGFGQIVTYLKFTTNINLSSNLLTQEVLNTLIKQRQKVPNLRIVNLAHNKVNERKAKVYVDQLKKQGIIVTLT